MSDYDRVDYDRVQQRSWLRTLIPFAIVFVAGLLTMGWILTRWEAATPYLSWMRPAPQNRAGGDWASAADRGARA